MERLPRWRQRLQKELSFRDEFLSLDELQWHDLLRRRSVTSSNHDTVLALDWPHFCGDATEACGGVAGWCYTFQGNQAGKLHNRHVAMVDVLARGFPALFAEAVVAEVQAAVSDGRLPYANLRYSGSGEIVEAYVPALSKIAEQQVKLWGFTRSLRVAESLREIGAAVIVSCDKTSPPGFIENVREHGFAIGYTSSDVYDEPPEGALVTFPIHRVGRVREVVDAPSVCPKVLADFLDDCRPKGSCQNLCQRCHETEVKP